jgi:hypothetical protein
MNQSTHSDGGGGAHSGGSGTGLLDATQGDVELHLSELNVGRHTGSFGTATGTLRWDQPDPIDATNAYFGRGPSTGILEVPVGGTFKLGTLADPLSLLAISYNDTGTQSGASGAHLDFTVTDPVFEAFSSNLTIGAKTYADGYGTANGSLILGSNSNLHVGALGSPGVVNIGMNQSTHSDGGGGAHSGGSGTGLLDATQGNVELHLSELNVGRHIGRYGTATGTFTMGNGSNVTTATANVGTTSGGIATGTINLTDGRLSAKTVNMGENGTFNFTGGRLELGTFNTYGGIGAVNQEGGTLAPGFSRTETSLPGIATINGDFNLYSGGILEVELFGLTIGLDYDQLAVNGAVNLNADALGGGLLDLMLGFAPTVGDGFLIVDNDGSDPIAGHFSGLSEGNTFIESFLGAAFTFQISYLGHTGNDVVLRTLTSEQIPAPAALVLGSFGVGLVSWLRRRRAL